MQVQDRLQTIILFWDQKTSTVKSDSFWKGGTSSMAPFSNKEWILASIQEPPENRLLWGALYWSEVGMAKTG